jgi:hypothetical protein
MSNFRGIASPNTLTSQETLDKSTREVTGDGGAFLKLKNCIRVLAVFMSTASGRMEIPMKEERQVMVSNTDNAPLETQVEDLVHLVTEGYDMPVLLRSELSNNGKWQKGVTFIIAGEWADDDAASSTVEPDPNAGGENGGSNSDDKEDVGLAPELLEKIIELGGPEKAIEATNEQFNAVGITGPAITKVRNALKKIVGA